MPYRFVTDKEDYSDYASGRFFYSAPGHPAFPVRLMSEVFQRCLAIRRSNGQTNRISLYDPCCGAAYHLSVLAFLHGNHLDTLIGSDVGEDILTIAGRNLGLLTAQGLEKRKREIEALADEFGKESHQTALETAARFQGRLAEMISQHSLKVHLFQADATQSHEIVQNLPVQPVDIVFADIPYNQHSAWKFSQPLTNPVQSPVWHLLTAVMPILTPHSIVTIAADKTQKIAHEAYRRVERFQVGKRQVVFLQRVV